MGKSSQAQEAAVLQTAANPLTMAKYLLLAMRPKQWTKNLLVFLAAIFTIHQTWGPSDLAATRHVLGYTFAAFALFCLISGAVYLINDLADIEKDRQHPTKRLRPLASGRLSVQVAWAAAAMAVVLSLVLSFLLSLPFGYVALAYLAVQLVYTFTLKHQVILDVFAIAGGFVLRAVAGAVVIDVPISPWLYSCTALGALFLGFSKRRHELTLLEGRAGEHRRILQEYTPYFLDQLIAVVTPATLIAYGLYTFSAENLPRNHAMMLTVPFVLYGIFRYLYLVHVKKLGGHPEEILLQDWPLIIDIVLWVAASGAILYVYR